MKPNFSQFVCASALVALTISAIEVLAGGKGGDQGEDIILYKNNIVIRGQNGGKGKGKGKGGGGGNLVLAAGGHEKEYHDLGWHDHEHGSYGGHGGYGEMGGHGHGHHGHHKEAPAFIFLEGNGGKGNKGKGGRGNGGKGKGGNDNEEMGMSIEQMLMAQMG